MRHKIERVDVADLNGDKLFLGIDSGSTTTKIVLIDEQGRVAFEYYVNNKGDAIGAVQQGLNEAYQHFMRTWKDSAYHAQHGHRLWRGFDPRGVWSG